jgi:ferredoxin--NADP+ reductase
VGDTVLVGRKPTGTLLTDNLTPGRTLYLFSTGTGLAPFMSLIRDPEMYGKFERVILTHTVRWASELAYHDLITRDLPENEYFGDLVRDKLVYYPTVTREPFRTQGRITDLIRSGRMAADLGLPDLDPALDRAMICGGPDMLTELKDLLEARGFKEGSSNDPADFVVEKAFVEK